MYWIRHLFTDPVSHLRAGIEVAVVTIFTLLPFLVIYFVHSANGTIHPVESVSSQLFGRGQMFLLAYGIFGTIFWLAFVKGDRPRHDARIALGLIATILVFPIVGFIGVDPTFSTIINPNVVAYGYWLYALLTFINYLLLYYMGIDPPEPKAIFNREASDMKKQFRKLPKNG